MLVHGHGQASEAPADSRVLICLKRSRVKLGANGDGEDHLKRTNFSGHVVGKMEDLSCDSATRDRILITLGIDKLKGADD